MRSSAPLQLWPEDKLDLLRYLDEFRFWHSLEDERRCTRCKRTITGKQILIFERQGTRGKMRLQCPTIGCVSTPSEWTYANPVLAASFKSEMPRPRFETASDNVGPVRGARRRNRAAKRTSSAGVIPFKGNQSAANSPKSIRALLARLPILRPIAMGLHAIHPVT
jgi:hypothetical protein